MKTAGGEHAQEWARQVFGRADLGDARLTRRLVTTGADLLAGGGVSLSRACGGKTARAEGAYRMARNSKVKAESIGEAGFMATLEGAKDVEVVLAVEDSTTLSYGHDVEGLGDLGGQAESVREGIWVHSVLAVNGSTGAVVGLLEQMFWTRDEQKRGQRHQRKKRVYADKESFKWQRASNRARARFGAGFMQRVISVCDREADIYPYLADKLAHGERFVVRAERNRRTTADKLLDAVMARAPMVGLMEVGIAQRGGRPSRTACLAVRSTEVTLLRPATASADTPDSITVNAVLAKERKKGGLRWLVLTTEPISTPAKAMQVLKWYARRWRIEEFHKAWKSGAGVERLHMQTRENLERMAVILAFVGVRFMQLRDTLDEAPDAPCDTVLGHEEWRILWVLDQQTPPPKKCPTVTWAYSALARQGGFLDTKGTGIASWQTIWTGWAKVEATGHFMASAHLIKM